MPNAFPADTNQNTALENMYRALKDAPSRHEEDPQLMLFLGIFLDNVSYVREACETFGANRHAPLTPRNAAIPRAER